MPRSPIRPGSGLHLKEPLMRRFLSGAFFFVSVRICRPTYVYIRKPYVCYRLNEKGVVQHEILKILNCFVINDFLHHGLFK